MGRYKGLGMPKAKKAKVTFVEPMKYDRVRLVMRGIEVGSRAERARQRCDELETTICAIQDGAPKEPPDLLQACLGEAQAVQCLFERVSADIRTLDSKIARVSRSLDGMIATCRSAPPRSKRSMRACIESLHKLHEQRSGFVKARHRLALERLRAAGLLWEAWTRIDLVLAEYS